MKIQKKDYYHGAVLTQIVEHSSYTAINKIDKKYGHYIINHNIRLMLKETQLDAPWTFKLNENDLSTIEDDIKFGDRFFLCLICKDETICLINANQLQYLIDISSRKPQTIQITNEWSLKVTSGRIKSPITIYHNAFPNKVFAS